VPRYDRASSSDQNAELTTMGLLAATGSATDLLAARYQMALSLGWHIVLAAFGVAFPLMILVLHRRGLRGDDDALRLARRWSKVAGVLFAIGAVSGTILSFEMGMLWPGLMGPFGDVIGLPFALEGISFFTEAIFLGIYLYGWDRLPGRVHSLMLVPVAIAGATGTFFILSVNAWMNSPEGFELAAGEVTDVSPLDAMFTAALPHEYVHMYVAAFMVVGFLVAAVYAAGMLRGRNDRYHGLGVWVPLAFASVAAVVQPVVGHLAGQRVADLQPTKLAAMEGQWETERGAELTIGGFYREGEGLVGGLRVPIDGLASFIAQNDFDAEIQGLADVPADERPPVNIVRYAFQTMVGIGTMLAGLGLVAGWWLWRRRGSPLPRWLLSVLVAAGPAAVLALEAGWVTTEVGRQPWIVYGIERTADAVTDVSWIWVSFGVIAAVYGLLTVAAAVVLRTMASRWRAGAELQAPYGPPGPLHTREPEQVR
jgi:cytochrome bd ubiquinol oxidase subunit I